MPINTNSIVLKIGNSNSNDNNDNNGINDKMIWKLCSRCGVASYKSDWCKPCKLKIFKLEPHPLEKFHLNTIIDIFNEVVLHLCRTLKIVR